jgi:hypothetical protein
VTCTLVASADGNTAAWRRALSTEDDRADRRDGHAAQLQRAGREPPEAAHVGRGVRGREESTVHEGTIRERHRALNWLIRYMNLAWDDVTTDT